MKRSLLTASLLLLALGCTKKEATPEPEVDVQAVHPTEGSISDQITADALLAPLAQAAISPRVSAPVKRFYVQRGAHVKAGQLLATLENSDLAAAALDTKGTYTAAQGSFETETRAQVPEDTAKAQTDLAQAKANLDLSQSVVNGRTQLFAQGAIPGRDLDTAKATLVQSQAAYDVAKLHLQSVEQISRKASLQSAEGQLTSAKGKYLGAEAQLSYTEIRSPISGIVTERALFAGETASAGTALLTVMDTSALLAKLHLSQVQAQQLVLGGAATVAVPGIADPIDAKVSLISPALDPGSTTLEVWLRVDNRDGKLKAGTPVRAVITGRTISHALLIPSDALQVAADGTSKFVMIVDSNSTARKRPVTIGIRTAEQVQVLSGISAADTVIVTGSYALDDKTKVKVGPPAAAGKDADDK
ncbi:efflux RND transporter periplasmic adaptor subunit [Granulicella arctica]|uniref:efflux RND transporter periplasmic adaptor subunit n=1 Tax=Granulicella arctica TaxID=940613 RepID=UPI0021E006D0|nr:efflux RND transporter periplasmic adaptor subunit [Granulicella arctica]